METDVVVFTGDKQLLQYENELWEVELFFPNEKLIENKGYIVHPFVLPYRGEVEVTEAPGIYKVGDAYTIVEPTSKKEKDALSVLNVRDINMDLSTILKDLKEHPEDFFDERDVEIINANTELSKFKIGENDDFLKILIKTAIDEKQINLKNYAHKLAKPYELGNMISILSRDTKMSTSKFINWCEVLGLKWKITVEDNGQDRLAPLPKKIIQEG